MNWKGTMQRTAKALMVPIVVMPVAALFIAIGQFGPDFFTAAGNAIIVDFLPLLFAVGVAIGFTDSDGMAAFAAVIGHVVLTAVMRAINPGITLASGEFQPNDMSVLGGIIVGAYTAALYRRFRNIRFPEFLGFFSGKRFIPIITALVSVAAGVVFGFLWPPINQVILAAGDWIFSTGEYGAFVYGVLNRLLIPTGLHHILQSLLLHVFGSFITPGGKLVSGEMARFFAGDPSAGAFSGGFFVIMIFAIPAAALAMVHESRSENRKKTAGIMLTAALTSIITGITEPVEFAFIFTAPLLFIIHSLLTGSALFISYLLGIRHYGYALPLFFMNYSLSEKPWLIFPLGAVYAVIYYFIFRLVIRKFNYSTPGREPAAAEDGGGPALKADLAETAKNTVAALGGLTNLRVVDACLTRLRVQVFAPEKIDADALKKLPAAGLNMLGAGNIQVVFGGDSDLIKDGIRQLIEQAAIVEFAAPFDGEIIPLEQFPDPVFAQGLLGPGVGFMPGGKVLVAPAAGEIVKVFPGAHALVMKTPEGLELLLHIGLDTVELEGAGFEQICTDGQQVQLGETLVKFDPEKIKAAGKELHSALVVTNKEAVLSATGLEKGKVSRGDVVYIVQIGDGPTFCRSSV
jgi:glucose-specific phosphotransferase system IIA component